MIVEAATQSHRRALLLLVAVALAGFLPGVFAIPPVDRDEARYAQAAKQMVESGDYVNIRFQDEPRLKKPIGIYWLQAAVVRGAVAAGVPQALTTIWLYRVPSIAGAVAAVGLTYWAALALVSRRAALLSALMMASSVLLGVEARLATTDAVLLATTVAAMGGLARVYLHAHGRRLSAQDARAAAAVVWTALAFGVLVKGPVIVLVFASCATTLAARDRSLRWLAGLRPLAGLPWFAALTLPWFVMVLAQPGAPLVAQWTGDILPRLFQGMEGHAAPPGYYFLLFWVTFWPGCALAGLAAPAVWAGRRAPATAFLLAWLVPSWLVFEMAVTKLPHYVLPLYPSIAILIAEIVDTQTWSRRPWLMRGAIWGAVFPLIAGALCLAALIVIGRQGGPLAWLLIGSAVLTCFYGWRHLPVHGAEHALLCGVMAAVLLSAGVFGVIVPRWHPLFPSTTFVDLAAASGCTERLVVTTTAYEEPSLVFLAGTSTRATDVAGAVTFLGGGPCRFALVSSADADLFAGEAREARLTYQPGGRIDGLNYTKGAAVTLDVYWSGPVERRTSHESSSR